MESCLEDHHPLLLALATILCTYDRKVSAIIMSVIARAYTRHFTRTGEKTMVSGVVTVRAVLEE